MPLVRLIHMSTLSNAIAAAGPRLAHSSAAYEFAFPPMSSIRIDFNPEGRVWP